MSNPIDTPELLGTDTQTTEWRHMTPAERARVRRADERARRRQADEDRADTFRAADAADTSGNPFSNSIRKPLGQLIYNAVSAYMKDQAHRAEFESWYLERYGTPYVWPGTEGTERTRK